MKKTCFVFVCFLLLFSCQSNKQHAFLQNAVDELSELYQKTSLNDIQVLMDKLYLRNPNELKKSGLTLAEIKTMVFGQLDKRSAPKILKNTRSRQSIYLAFDENYSGDRVLALIYGMTSMLMDAYDNKTKFIFTDTLSAQKFYNLARNFAIVNWKLNNNKKTNNQLFLYSNSLKTEKSRNLSFERLFGKIINQQDLMAITLEQLTNQTIRGLAINFASSLLLPV